MTQGQVDWEAVYGGLGCDFLAENDTNCDGSANALDIDPFVAQLVGAPLTQRVQMTYDYANQMVEYADLEAGVRHTYSYDPLGRRIGRIVDADGTPLETNYVYSGSQVIEEQDVANATTATYVYGGRVDEVLNMQRDVDGDGTLEDYYYHGDDLHSVMALSDVGGNVVERYDYGDYGAPEIAAYLQEPDQDEVLDADLEAGPSGIVQRVADTFVLPVDAVVTGFNWWGGYSDDIGAPAADDFRIKIYADASGLPGTLLYDEHIGNNRTRWLTDRIITSGSGNVPEYAYLASLTESFAAEAGVTYWFSIENDTTGHATTWGWGEQQQGEWHAGTQGGRRTMGYCVVGCSLRGRDGSLGARKSISVHRAAV